MAAPPFHIAVDKHSMPVSEFAPKYKEQKTRSLLPFQRMYPTMLPLPEDNQSGLALIERVTEKALPPGVCKIALLFAVTSELVLLGVR